MTYLTERQAWTRIAEAFAQYEATGQKRALVEWGLCAAVDGLLLDGCIGFAIHQSMQQKVHQALHEKCLMDGRYSVWLAPGGTDGAGLRAMLATLFAEDSAVQT